MAKVEKYITVGRIKGKRIRKHFYGNSNQEVEAKIRKYFADHSKITNPSDVTFRQYREQWQDAYKSNKSNATKEMYDGILKKFDLIDGKKLMHITKSDCQKVVNESWDYPRTAQLVKLTLNQIFNTAIDDGIIASNPAKNIEVPKYRAKEKRALTDEEIQAVKNADLNDSDRMFVTILMTFGLRPSEALALQRNDFDMTNDVLHITKALSITRYETVVKSTKTDANRDIPIPKQIKPMLNTFFRQNKRFYLFVNKNGHLHTKSSYKRLSERIFKAVDIAYNKDNENMFVNTNLNFYDFRHHRATQLFYLCQKGTISTKKAAYLMGHSEQIFLSVYSHIDEKKEDTESLYADLVI